MENSMDKADIKSNLKNVNQWTRILYMILFAVIFNVASFVIGVVVLAQALFAIVTGGQNDNVQKLGTGLAYYISEILSYLTYTAEEKPFPFKSWPDVDLPAPSESQVEEVAVEEVVVEEVVVEEVVVEKVVIDTDVADSAK
tara:strand:- start:170 stop:592 length:423 start_codon:yes stop_codon:yes gene_type:complete